MDVGKILEAVALRSTPVTIAGQTVVVREPSILERGEYRALITTGATPEAALPYLVQRCVSDEDGQPVFTAEQAVAFVNGGAAALPLLALVVDYATSTDAKNA